MTDPTDEIRALLDLGRHREAAAAAERTLAQDPDHVEVLRLYASALVEFAPDAAMGPAARALALRPGDPDVLMTAARVRLTVGDPRSALTAVDAAIALVPNAPGPHRFRAAIFFSNASMIRGRARQRQLDDARASAETAVRLHPNSPDSHALLAMIATTDGRHHDARNHAAEALRLDPDHAEARAVLGEVAEDEGDIRAAGDHYLASARRDVEGGHRLDRVGERPTEEGRRELWLLGIAGLVVAVIIGGFSRGAGLVAYLVIAAALVWYWAGGRAARRRRALSEEARRARDDRRDLGPES